MVARDWKTQLQGLTKSENFTLDLVQISYSENLIIIDNCTTFSKKVVQQVFYLLGEINCSEHICRLNYFKYHIQVDINKIKCFLLHISKEFQNYVDIIVKAV